MGNSNSLKLSLKPEEIKAIEEETGFTLGQIGRLHSRFTKLDQESKGYLEREDMLSIPELAINPLGDRIVHAFFNESQNGTEEDRLDFNVCILEGGREIKCLNLIAGFCESALPLPANTKK